MASLSRPLEHIMIDVKMHHFESVNSYRNKFTDLSTHAFERHHLTKLVRSDIEVEVESLTLVSFDLWQHTLQNLQRLLVVLCLNLYELQQDQ